MLFSPTTSFAPRSIHTFSMVKTVKRVRYSTTIKIVTGTGSIKYERDWGATSQAFDFLGQNETIDFIQRTFEKHLSMLGSTGKEDLERFGEFGLPLFSCTEKVAGDMGAVEYLKLLAQEPNACGPPGTQKTQGISLTMLPKKKGKRRGVLQPKEIPGRDTPESRKMRIMAGQQETKIFQKYYSQCIQEQQPSSEHQGKIPDSILKAPKNDSNVPFLIDLTCIDDAGLFEAEERDDERERTHRDESFTDDFIDEREQSVSMDRETPASSVYLTHASKRLNCTMPVHSLHV